jgi:hypothetical protein
MRYGDVENPHPWVVAATENESAEVGPRPLGDPHSMQVSLVQQQEQPGPSPASTSYWHVPSQTSLPVPALPPSLPPSLPPH